MSRKKTKKKTTPSGPEAIAEAPSTNGSALEADRARVLQAIEDDIVDADEAERNVESYDEATIKAAELRVDLRIKIEKKERRKEWDKTLLKLVVIGFGSSYLIVICIGAGWLDFGDNAFAVPSVVAAGILQTYGLARIAAEYFFSEDGRPKRKKR